MHSNESDTTEQLTQQEELYNDIHKFMTPDNVFMNVYVHIHTHTQWMVGHRALKKQRKNMTSSKWEQKWLGMNGQRSRRKYRSEDMKGDCRNFLKFK